MILCIFEMTKLSQIMKKSKIVKNIKDLEGLRKSYNLTVIEFSAKLGISTPTYYDLIKGKTKTISKRIRDKSEQFIKTSESENHVNVISKVERRVEVSRHGNLVISNFAILGDKNRAGIIEAINKFYLFEKDPFS